MREQFGNHDFGLTEEQEDHAARLHRGSIIIDTLFQGPCGYRSFDGAMLQQLQDDHTTHNNPMLSLWQAVEMPIRRAIAGHFPDFHECWSDSGITGGNRQVGGNAPGEDLPWFALNQAQFDNLPWLNKATRAQHFRDAKRDGTHVGFVSTQNTLQFGLDLNLLNRSWELGMRMVQLTYNSVNFVGGGCTDRVDCGVTDFGVRFIKRLNELGMLVDTGHCGKQTTLDACAISNTPVVASHTSASGVHLHDRAKSDDELQRIAGTGGYIGVYAVGMFLTDDRHANVEHMLDHIDYIASLVGWQHVGIGSDWPMQTPLWGLEMLGRYATEIGFREEHGVTAPKNLIGFDDYRDMPNITRGLMARGYSDDAIRGILGGNFLRVFEQVCG